MEAVWGLLVVGGDGLAASLLVSGGKEELHLIVDLSDTRSVTLRLRVSIHDANYV